MTLAMRTPGIARWRQSSSQLDPRLATVPQARSREHLIDILSDQSRSSPLRTREVVKLMALSWGQVSQDLTRHGKFEPLLEAVGWRYVNRRGPGGKANRSLIQDFS